MKKTIFWIAQSPNGPEATVFSSFEKARAETFDKVIYPLEAKSLRELRTEYGLLIES